MNKANAVIDSADLQNKNPAERLAKFRESRVAWWPEMRGWAVSRYDDVRAVLSNHETFSSDVMQSAFFDLRPGEVPDPNLSAELQEMSDLMPFDLIENPSIICIDPPNHSAMRSLVSRAFMPRHIAAWQIRTEQVAKELIAKVAGKKHFDLVKDFAGPLPTVVVADILGVESEKQEEFKRWSDTLLESITAVGEKQGLKASGYMDAAVALSTYLAEQVAEREKNPKDDVLSLLVDDSRGPRLSLPDACSFAQLMLVAGNETTTHLITSLCLILFDQPLLVSQLMADETLIEAVIEETLRLESPTQMLFRRVRKDTSIAGQAIAKDDVIVAMLGAANRDPEIFEEADTLQLNRKSKRGRAQTAFGYGPHFCVGSALARMEAKIAIKQLLPLLAKLKLDRDNIDSSDSYVIRGYSSLPVLQE